MSLPKPPAYRFEDPRLRDTAATLLNIARDHASASCSVNSDIRAAIALLRDIGADAVQCEVTGTARGPGGRMSWDPEREDILFGGGPGLERPLLACSLGTRAACHSQLADLFVEAAKAIDRASWERRKLRERRVA